MAEKENSQEKVKNFKDNSEEEVPDFTVQEVEGAEDISEPDLDLDEALYGEHKNRN